MIGPAMLPDENARYWPSGEKLGERLAGDPVVFLLVTCATAPLRASIVKMS